MLTERMRRAALLDVNLYEEVERDPDATTQALTVVIIVALASGIGAALAGALSTPGQERSVIGGVLGGVLQALFGWVAWSAITYFVGTRFIGGTATLEELLRTIGFAQSPGVLLLFRFIPFFGGLVIFVVGIWQIVAGVIAVRQALDVSTGQAIATVILGFIGVIVVSILISLVLAALGLAAGLLP